MSRRTVTISVSRNPKSQIARPAETWRPEYAITIEKLALAGFSPERIAETIGVRPTCMTKWLESNQSAIRAWRKGTAHAAGDAAKALLHRATGYSHPDEQLFYDRETGTVVRAQTTKHYPPQTEAGLAILRQHVRGEWKPQHQHELSGPNGMPLPAAQGDTYNTLVLLGSSPEDQRKASMAYQALIRGTR